MLPKAIEYAFDIDGQHYRLVEWDRGGERRMKADYALAIAAAPQVIESIDGANLYAEAVARECLKEAPEMFWETLPASASTNGSPRRIVSLEHISRALWVEFRKEVDAFLGLIFPAVQSLIASALDPGAGEPPAMASAEAVPPLLRGRAE